MPAVEAFREKLATDPVLQAQVRQTIEAGGGMEELLNLAGAQGYSFTTEEAMNSFAESELSDFELEMVSGGKVGVGLGFGRWGGFRLFGGFGRRGW